MPLPDLVPGLVMRYSYLWHSEYLERRKEGRKDRPSSAAYGMLPSGLFALVRDRFLALVNSRAARQVRPT